MLMDSDALGGHIKGTHKMKEKEYKEQFCVYKQRSLTPRASENKEVVVRKNMLKRKPSEQTQEEEMARPRKKLKEAILTKEKYFVGFSMDLNQEQTEQSGRSQTGGQDMQTEGSNQEKRKKPTTPIGKKIIAHVEEEEVAGEGSVETQSGSKSERKRRSIESSRSMQNDRTMLHIIDESPMLESVPLQTLEEDEAAVDKESDSSEMKQVERMDRITNKRVGALKKENRIFKESVLGNSGVQMLGGNGETKPPGRNASELSSSKEGRSRAELRKKAGENFDPFVDVEYDCNLKDCQDCGKV